MASMSGLTALKRLTEATPIVSVLKYAHIGVAASNLLNSVAFYEKVGLIVAENADEGLNAVGSKFLLSSLSPPPLFVSMVNASSTFRVHVFPSDRPLDDDRNLLMDYPETKYPGHTHASFQVPNVAGVRHYMETTMGIPVSGTRGSMAIFVRDPDRTTLEFERNDGKSDDKAPEEFQPETIGNGKCMDHVGIRIRAPYDEKLLWYAEKLGFISLLRVYDANPDPLKNFPPWISSTDTHCEINFIINANMPPLDEVDSSILTVGGVSRPGLQYVAFEVADVLASKEALINAGVEAVADEDLDTVKWGRGVKATLVKGGSFFIRDLDGNLLRIVGA